jgi:hypothetical protein
MAGVVFVGTQKPKNGVGDYVAMAQRPNKYSQQNWQDTNFDCFGLFSGTILMFI